MTRRERVLPQARFEDPVIVATRKRLWTAQRGACPYCPKRLAHVGWDEDVGRLQGTIEHVWPKRLRGKHKHSARLGVGLLLAHQVCNGLKGNRTPYPCELIFLAATNARLVL